MMLGQRQRRRGNGGNGGSHGASCAGVACEHTLGRQPLHLYGYLWAKPEFIHDDKSGTFSFVVPDTVLFKQQKPVKWFFTSKQDKGKILVKSKKNLSVTHVLSAFLEPKRIATNSTNNGAATWASTSTAADDDNTLIVATFTYVDRSSSGEFVLVVEHLTRAALHQLLTNREKPTLSVLQRFIPTRSGYNHLIQSVFTPDNCLVRKCVSPHVMSDLGLCIAERTATFEADERHVQPREVTNRELRDQIEHMHLEMSTHLQKIIGKPVARHVAYFKIGADDRIYLLWSSMLSFETGQLAFAKHLKLSLSHHDRLQHLVATSTRGKALADRGISSSSASSNHAQTKKCPRCRIRLPRGLVDFFATYKAVIKAHQADPRDLLSRDESMIPPLLDEILSPISEQRFKELSQESAFLYRTIALCQACAKHINTQSAKKLNGRSTERTGIEASSSQLATSERAKPIYMQSAHSIFWGKVERQEDAQRTRKLLRTSVAVRPASASTQSRASRASATANGGGRPTYRLVADGLTRASVKRLLPLLDSQPVSHEPKHCMQKLAEHLQRTYGGPSVRLALTRAGIYPATSLVSLDTLQWVCEAKLLADVFTHWTDFCKINGREYSASAMDVDALDAVLSVSVTSETTATKTTKTLPHAQAMETIVGPSDGRSSDVPCTPDVAIRVPTSSAVVHPVRPSTTRPSSCGGSRPASVRTSRLIVHHASASRSPHKNRHKVPERTQPGLLIRSHDPAHSNSTQLTTSTTRSSVSEPLTDEELRVLHETLSHHMIATD